MKIVGRIVLVPLSFMATFALGAGLTALVAGEMNHLVTAGHTPFVRWGAGFATLICLLTALAGVFVTFVGTIFVGASVMDATD